MDASTREDFAAWGMMVGRQEGRFLELLVFATQATRVLEIGTFTGYSSIAMAAGLAQGGCDHLARGRPAPRPVGPRQHRRRRAREPHQRDRGPGAAHRSKQLQGPFDLVFIDADKVSYDAYYEAVLPKLAAARADRGRQHAAGRRRAGLARAPPRGRRALRAFNDKVVNDPRVVCVLTTIRDGVTLIRHARPAEPGTAQEGAG